MKKSEKGSVTLIVLATVLTIMIILFSYLTTVSLKRKSQLMETMELQNAYYGDMNAVYEEQVAKWDKPTDDAPDTSVTTKSIDATFKQTKSAITGSSEIVKVEFSYKENTKTDWSSWTELTEEEKKSQASTGKYVHTFSGLTYAKYDVRTRATNANGNSTISLTTSVHLPEVTALISTDNVTFTTNPSTFTNSDVTLTISTKELAFELQYKDKDTDTATDWTSINVTTTTIDSIQYQIVNLTIKQNQTVYARLTDGINNGGTA